MSFAMQDRVLATRRADGSSWSARVIEVCGEFAHGRGWTQTQARVRYEADSRCVWHNVSDLSPLDEDAPIEPMLSDDEDVGFVDTPSWTLLPLWDSSTAEAS